MRCALWVITAFAAMLIGAPGCGDTREKTGAEPSAETEPSAKISLYEREFKAGTREDSVPVAGYGIHTYALYLPSGYSPEKKLPVIYGFDPQGNGVKLVKQYQDLAEKYQYILMGSNTSKNGLPPDQSLEIGSLMMHEAQKRIGADPSRQYATGFSGGGRVATLLAATYPEIQAVVSCGAGYAPGVDPGKTQFSFLGIIGEEDFNFWEMFHLGRGLENAPYPNTWILHDRGHEWPQTDIMEGAFLWFEADAMRKRQGVEAGKIFDSLSRFLENPEIPLFQSPFPATWYEYHWHKMRSAFLKGWADQDENARQYLGVVLDKIKILEKGAALKEDLQGLEKAQQDESRMCREYGMALQTQDLKWWRNATQQLWQDASHKSSVFQRGASRRTLSYLSLAVYGPAGQALAGNDLAAARKFIAIYQMVDPENAEHRFMAAKLAGRENQPEKVIELLKEAAKLGFDDANRYQNDPDFAGAKQLPEFDTALQLITKNQD